MPVAGRARRTDDAGHLRLRLRDELRQADRRGQAGGCRPGPRGAGGLPRPEVAASMLEVEDLRVCYGNIQAVRGVDLSVAPGKVTLVLGANGAGKTTTLKAIAGLEPPVAGAVTLEGGDITGLAPHKMVGRALAGARGAAGVRARSPWRRTCGWAATPRTRRPPARPWPGPRDVPDPAGARDSPAGPLSGGEQQMLVFGRALMAQPTYHAARRALDGTRTGGRRRHRWPRFLRWRTPASAS